MRNFISSGDTRARDECKCYEIKPDGSYGAIKGKHDDIYMSRAMALKASQLMELPCEIHKKQPRREGSFVHKSGTIPPFSERF